MILITQSLKELQQIMSDYVGIVRNTIRLERAMKRIDLLFEETEHLYQNTSVSPQLLELRNMITVGYLIIKGAAFRKESRGPALQHRLSRKVKAGTGHRDMMGLNMN
jgi:L-aspartate oxidase